LAGDEHLLGHRRGKDAVGFAAQERWISIANLARSVGVVHNPAAAISG